MVQYQIIFHYGWFLMNLDNFHNITFLIKEF
jgi:hypothetical protein